MQQFATYLHLNVAVNSKPFTKFKMIGLYLVIVKNYTLELEKDNFL